MTPKAMNDVRFATVDDVMTREVALIDGSKSVADAVRLMKKKGLSSLVVNRRSRDDAWGIVTRKDVVTKVVDPGRHPVEVRVFEIMSKPIITVSPELALKYCARLMTRAGIRRAPVVDGGEIVGIVSNTDIFNAINV